MKVANMKEVENCRILERSFQLYQRFMYMQKQYRSLQLGFILPMLYYPCSCRRMFAQAGDKCNVRLHICAHVS